MLYSLTTKSDIALYIILSDDMQLLKSDLFSRSEFLVDPLVDIFRAAEKYNPTKIYM